MLPQIIYCSLLMLGLSIHINKDGEATIYSAKATAIGVLLQFILLYWAGFFDPRLVI